MQGVQQSYTQYFNRRHKKSGHLFEGRYKAILCQEDRYLLELIRYIHLNPVRAGIVKRAEQYGYSGHHAYLQGKRTEVIEPARVLRMLGEKPGLSEVRERGTGRRPSGRVLGGGGPAISRRPGVCRIHGGEKDVEVPRPKAKSRIDRAQETWVNIWLLKSRCCAERTGVGRYRRRASRLPMC